MTTNEPPEETKVSDCGMVTIPAAVRRRPDIEPGDKLQWDITAEGDLTVEVVKVSDRQQPPLARRTFEEAAINGDSLNPIQ